MWKVKWIITCFSLKFNLAAVGTHKIKKTSFQREGFDLKKITDQVFFMDVKQKKYVPLTLELCQMINQGEIRI